MEELQQYEWIAQYLAGELEAAEKVAFDAWLKEAPAHQELFEDMQQLWQASASTETTYTADKKAAWERFESTMEWEETQKKPSSKKILQVVHRATLQRLLRIAAVFLLVAAALFWLYNPSGNGKNELAIITTQDVEKQVTLPDGSSVWLNKNSELTYQQGFETNRRLQLKGEAFFDVKRDEAHPFKIKSGLAETVVLGTSFNIRAYEYEDEIELTVSSGKVSFTEWNKPAKTVVLTENEMGVLDKEVSKVYKKIPETTNALAWKTKIIVFEDTRLEQVIKTLKRYYDTSIDVDNQELLNCQFTARFEDKSLQDIVNTLSFGLDLTTKQEGNTYVFSGEGCE